MAADSSYPSVVQVRQDGNLAVPSGKSINFEAEGGLKILDVATDRILKCARVALAAVDTGGGFFSWQNPEASAIIVTRLELDITTAASGACTVDCGMTATSGTTSADNLIDGLDINAAAGVFDNLGNAGTNGKARQKVAAGKWLTGSKAAGATAGVVGFAYLWYHTI